MSKTAAKTTDTTSVTYDLPQFARLQPRSAWRGGRVTDIDLVTLDEAAIMASQHADVPVSVGDFLRAASRGEIGLNAVCPETVTMQPCRDGEPPLDMPAGCVPRLPIDACRALSVVGRAEWRTCESMEPVPWLGGVVGRFVRWQLPDEAAPIVTTIADCRVTGHDVHALADQFIGKPEAEDELAEPAGAATPSSPRGIGPTITTDQLCAGFDGLKWTSLEWRQTIKKRVPAWLKECKADRGTGGAAHTDATWWPINVALALAAGRPRGPAVDVQQIDRAFRLRPALKTCAAVWTAYREDHPELGEVTRIHPRS